MSVVLDASAILAFVQGEEGRYHPECVRPQAQPGDNFPPAWWCPWTTGVPGGIAGTPGISQVSDQDEEC